VIRPDHAPCTLRITRRATDRRTLRCTFVAPARAIASYYARHRKKRSTRVRACVREGGTLRGKVDRHRKGDVMEITCRAPRRVPRYEGDVCSSFVARVADGSRFVRIVQHSSEGAEGNTVSPCRRCKVLHEIAPPGTPTLRLVA
jgi:hypothetical protein